MVKPHPHRITSTHLVHTEDLQAGVCLELLSIFSNLAIISIQLVVGIVMDLPDGQQVLGRQAVAIAALSESIQSVASELGRWTDLVLPSFLPGSYFPREKFIFIASGSFFCKKQYMP